MAKQRKITQADLQQFVPELDRAVSSLNSSQQSALSQPFDKLTKGCTPSKAIQDFLDKKVGNINPHTRSIMMGIIGASGGPGRGVSAGIIGIGAGPGRGTTAGIVGGPGGSTRGVSAGIVGGSEDVTRGVSADIVGGPGGRKGARKAAPKGKKKK